MFKGILLSLILSLMCMISSADTYVIFDRSSGDIKGAASISDDAVLDWTKNNILKKP